MNPLILMNKANPKILNEEPISRDTSDHVFEQMLFAAFQNEEKLVHLLNGKDQIEFIRCYTDLLGHLFYLKLLLDQWNYYHQIGIAQNIWTNRVPKHVAEKNSMEHAYGRSKRMIEQRRTQIQQKLEHSQNALVQFEQQMLSQSVPNIDYSSEMNSLSSIVRTFVQEKQEQLCVEFEHKRNMLILDATDHRLVRSFFDLKPNKGQVRTERIYFLSFD